MDTMNCKRFLLGAVTCAMVMNLEGVAATKATKINEKIEQELLLNHVWQQDAYLYISSRWKNSNLENCPWWKQFKYEDSIFAVIPKAIADFVLKQDVFGNKDNYVFGQTNRKFSLINLIKFTGAEPTSMKYTPANWNALVLYNFISKFILDTNDSIQIREVIDRIKKDLIAYYNNSFQDKIEKAAKDINTYIEDLALTGYLKEVKDVISKKRFAQNAVNTALSKENKENILLINYINVIPTNASFNVYNNNTIVPTYKAPEEAEAQLQFRISFPADSNDTYKPIKPKLDFIPMNKETKFEDNYESLPTTKTSGLLKFVPNRSQNAVVGLEFVAYPNSWKDALRNELPKKYALDIKGFDVNEMNKLLVNNFEKQWLKVRNMLRAKDCLGNDYNKSLQILQKLKNLNIIRQIYASDDEILLYCHNLKQENQHYTAQAYNYILDALNDYCAKVFYACENTNISDFEELQKFVNRLLKNNWDEERAETYIKFLKVAEEIMEYGIYDDDAMVLNELLSFNDNQEAIQKYKKACKDCLQLYEKYCMSDKIKGAGAEVVKLLFQEKGSEAELRVQTILAQRFHGDEKYKSEIEKSAGWTYEEKVKKCADDIRNIVNNLYDENDGEYGISNFKNKDEIKGKIIDLHCSKEKIAEWIEEVLINNND